VLSEKATQQALQICRDLVAGVNRVDIVVYTISGAELTRKKYRNVKAGDSLHFSRAVPKTAAYIRAIGYHADGREIYYDEYPFASGNVFTYIVPGPYSVHYA
jgi:hypothetical protein